MLISASSFLAQSDLKSQSNKTITPIPNTNISAVTPTVNPLKADTIKQVTVDSLDTEDDDEPLEHSIVYNAKDSIRYETEGNKIYLFGDAYVEYESMNLKAEFIEIDNSKNIISAYGRKDSLGKDFGNPIFKDGEQEISCGKMTYNLKTKKGKIYNVLTKEGDLIMRGSEVKKDSNDVVYFKHLDCIPCQYDDARTMFKASRAKVIPNDKIVTGPMYLEIGGVPTPLGLPFGYFPNTKKRHNGILIPFYGNSDALGLYLKDGGFYWGINDKVDMTFRGDIYGNGSWGLRTLNNYNVNYKYNGSLTLGFSEFKNGEKELPKLQTKQRDILINWRHNQDLKNNPTVRFTSDVNVRTSKYNQYNSQNTGQYLQNTFQSNINFTKIFKNSSLGLNGRHDQNTQTRIMNISLPELTFNVNRFFPFKNEARVKQNVFDKIGINYLLEAKNSLSGIDTSIFKGKIADKLKYGIRHSLPISTNITVLKYFTLTPALNLSAMMYTKSTSKQLNEVTNTIKTDTVLGFKTGYDANFSTALNTKLFMDYIFKGKRVKQIRHLLIPSLGYTYRPDFGKTQYGFWKNVLTDTTTKRTTKYTIFENNIFGGPAMGEQNALSVNLSNNIEGKFRKKTDTGFVYNKATILQNLSIGGNYNFAADSFQMSAITITARTPIFKFFDVVFNSSFDPYNYDAFTYKRTKELAYNVDGSFATFVNGNIALSANLSSSNLQNMIVKKPDLTNGAERGAIKTEEEKSQTTVLPWNLNVYYNVNYFKLGNSIKDVQTLNFRSDIDVTKNWKFGLTSGYDFTSKKASYTSINIYRDLHCWEAAISWVPFGFNKSYNFTINIKSSMLSDIKIPRQRQWYDNY